MTKWADIKTALNADGVVLLPTETVYGLAACADNVKAVDEIYAIKGRDFDKPLAVCVRGLAQAEMLAYFDETARDLAKRYWPGSLTLVVDARDGIKLDKRVMSETEQGPTIALRCPDTDWVKYLDVPLALTSANKSGEPDAITYEHAKMRLGEKVAASLPANSPLSGAPSTIIRVSNGELTLLRQGELVIKEITS